MQSPMVATIVPNCLNVLTGQRATAAAIFTLFENTTRQLVAFGFEFRGFSQTMPADGGFSCNVGK